MVRFGAWLRFAPSTAPCRLRSARSTASEPAWYSTCLRPAIAPGQVVTVYEDDMVLGGGWIEGAIEQPD